MRFTSTTLALTFTFSLFTATPALSQQPSPQPAVAPARGEVLVLGVFHMSNPKRDVFNVDVDDVLSARRQSEMADVIAALERFRPSKIAVEADFSDDRVARRYAEYVAGKYELTRNETEQIGFRLARKLGHKTVYPVDVDGEFPYPRVVKFAQATGRSKQFDALIEEVGATVKAQSAYLASHTLLETLLYVNADEKVARDVGFYYRQAELGEPWDWAGADLVSDWVRRNMRIYSNVVQLAESPNERVLLIYGAGHLGWLQQAFAGNPNFRLRRLAEFVQP